LAAFCLTVAEKAVLQAAIPDFEFLNKISVKMQKDSLTMDEARALLDLVIARFPDAVHKVGKSAPIVKYPDFENGVVKILQHKENELSVAESDAVGKLLKPVVHEVEAIPNVVEMDDPDDIEATLKNVKRRRDNMSTASSYINLEFICPTSNIVERLFSRCKLTLTSLRASMKPDNLESVLFLLYNKQWWDMKTVAGCNVSAATPDVMEDVEFEAGFNELQE